MRRCESAAPISARVMRGFQLPQPPIPTRWTRSPQIRNPSSARLEKSPKPDTQTDGDDRPFGMGGRLICGIQTMPIELQALSSGNGQGLSG